MQKVKILAIVIVALLVSGCYTLSINPLYNKDNVVFEESLLGIWGNPENSEETWIFKKSDDNAYRLVVKDKGVTQSIQIKKEGVAGTFKKTGDGSFILNVSEDPVKDGIFEVHLMKLDGQLFMDVYPEKPKSLNDMYSSHIIQAHSFFKLILDDDKLCLASLNNDWLKKNLKSKKINIKHINRDGMIILTDSTEELQKFVVKYADKAFEELDEAYRLD